MNTDTLIPIGLKVSRCKTGTFDGYRLDVSDADGPYALVGRKQDADLFAAASELLAACVEAEQILDGAATTPGRAAALVSLRAAIAKATGR